MNDIICPQCGHKFLGRNCVFDLSDEVAALLSDESSDVYEYAQNVVFNFAVDEDDILIADKSGTDIKKIECSSQNGPSSAEECFPFRITFDLLYRYVLSVSGLEEGALNALLKELSEYLDSDSFDYRPSAQSIEVLTEMFSKLFKNIAATKREYIDLEDDKIRSAARVVTYIYNNRSEAVCKTLYVQTYSYNLNKKSFGRVPDMLFIWKPGECVIKHKRCPHCSSRMPHEFGYYKMKSVVLWGGHYSGKTSYLLSMFNMVTENSFFINKKEIRAEILTDDPWYEFFEKNVKLFNEGFAPEKTDRDNVPILNLKVGGSVIYSFIDWPGERFINDKGEYIEEDSDIEEAGDFYIRNTSEESGVSYVYGFRPIVKRASHVMFFIPPPQVDESVLDTVKESGSIFDSNKLLEVFKAHVLKTNPKYLRSVGIILNKADGINMDDKSISTDFLKLVQDENFPESKLYAERKWNNSYFTKIYESTQNGYFGSVNDSFIERINGMLESLSDSYGIHVDEYYVPVKPYGFEAKKKSEDASDENRVHRGCFQGVPYLFILKKDGVIE